MKRLSWAAATAFLTFAPLAAQAQIKLLPECTATGNCGISDMLAVGVNLAEFLLGIVGAIALGYFVYGGFVFIASRGNKGEVDRAFGILRSAAIGIFIIFLSGVFVRFTTEALTGGQSKIPTVGETCDSTSKKSVAKGDGLWILLPGGNGPSGFIPEGLACIKKEETATKAGMPCAELNSALAERGRPGGYTCMDVANVKQGSCVRGLCSKLPAQYACCVNAPTTAPATP